MDVVQSITELSVADETCPDCGGDLAEGEYKDQSSVTCTECGTPRVVLWNQ